MALTRSDVLRTVGELDDATVDRILSLDPTEAELREAVGWLEGDEALEASLGEPSSQAVRSIVALIQTVEDEEPDEPVMP